MKKVIDIHTTSRCGRTVLKNSFAAHPYKLADLTDKHEPGNMQLMLRSSSPGLFDGDHYHFNIRVGAKSSLTLMSQSYQRLFTMKSGASQHMDIVVEEGGHFHYLPHPLVPQTGSIFHSKNKISLEAGAQLVWGEVITCGRKLNGEAFLFNSLINLTEVYYKGKLLIRDNLVMKPALQNVQGRGQLEGYTHQASLVIIDERIVPADLVAAIHEKFSLEKTICFGVSALAADGIMLRLLGNKAEQLHQLLQVVASDSISCHDYSRGTTIKYEEQQ